METKEHSLPRRMRSMNTILGIMVILKKNQPSSRMRKPKNSRMRKIGEKFKITSRS